MNDPNFVQFKKERDLGAMITDTFKFFRLEWKPFFTTIIKAAIIPIIIAIIAIIFYTSSFSSFFEGFAYASYDAYGDEPEIMDFGMFFISALAFLLAYLVAYSVITVSGLSYIRSYIENNGVVNFEDVSTATKEKFWSYVGLLFLSGLIVGIGMILCLIPGIYLWVPLALSTCLLIFEKRSVGDSISYSFDFIKGHWWDTFGILLVIQLIIGVLGALTDVPATIYQLVQIGIDAGNQDPTAMMGIFSDPIYLMLLAFSYFFKILLYIVSVVTTVFIYYDINEQKNASGSMEMIDSLGS
jgi:hypothetical protein